MAKNLNQLVTAATTINATDKMYIARSPFGATDDRYILGSSIIAQFPTPLTTKGDIYTFTTLAARLPVAVGDGKILQVSSGAATGLAYSTPTYPSTSGTSGKILASDGTNVVYSTATFPVVGGAAGNIFISDGTNYVASTSLWPNTVGSSGKIVVSNGTSNVYSTPTYPNASVTSGTIIISDGTNYIASTSIFPNTVGTAGKIIRSDGTVNAYSQTTYPDLVAQNAILFGTAANTVGPITPSASGALVSSAANVPAWSSAMTNGQVILGSTGATPVAATIGASGNLSWTVGAGTLSISTSGSANYSFVVETTTARTLTAFQAMIANNAGVVTGTIPATAAVGDIFEIVGFGAGGWKLQANTGQIVHLGSSATSSAGSLASTNQYDGLQVVCVVANTTFLARSVIGNLTVA